eukprot:Partr_v1_DN28592_c4_g2_i2_m73913 putative DnaJ (Hsp40) homolog, subfamily C, member 7
MISASAERARDAEKVKIDGNVQFKLGNYGQAIDHYSSAIDLYADVNSSDHADDGGAIGVKATLLSNRAAAYLMASKFQQAIDDCQTSLSLEFSQKVLARLAKCYASVGNTAEASRILRKDHPTSDYLKSLEQCDLLIQNARTALELNDFARASMSVQQALSTAGLSVTPVRWRLIQCACMIGKSEINEATLILNDIIRNDSSNAEAWYLRGKAAYMNGDIASSFKFFPEALRADPDFSKARILFKKAKLLESSKESGNVAFKAGNLEEAVELYSKALEVDPDNSAVNCKLYSNRAIVYAKLNKLELSVKDCDSALAIDEKFIKVITRRADNYMKLEKYEEAVRDYE